MSSLRVLQVGTSPSLQAMPRLQALFRPSLPPLCPQLQQLLWPPISRHKSVTFTRLCLPTKTQWNKRTRQDRCFSEQMTT
ncbi:hypothetical protein NP493_4539g00006 [Ridgeia piscesae]|uniref:Uncharacterized protein n=1 Tax=Ridgeia piscesae TaxID=27915 RepID=A0AAD9IY86_RIDPI|nr:hypothetical protein NP493_4539g00006 [Ridgeia piscesae]